jgi:hypothetical protein
MHQSLQGSIFHVEHILPSSQGGATALENLAWACPACNSSKSDRIRAIDPSDGTQVEFYHPRNCAWSDHFRWDGYRIDGLTAIGRATIAILDLNSARRLLIRQAEEVFDLFPPQPPL